MYILYNKDLTKLRKDFGNRVIGTVCVDDAISGMKGLPVLFH
jgi:hypothetical protein